MIGLGVWAAAATGVAVWLGLQRARVGGEQADIRRRAAEAEEALERARDEARDLHEAAADLRARAESLVERHEAEIESVKAIHDERESAMQRVHAERLEGEARARKELEQRVGELNEAFKREFSALAGDALAKSSEQFLKLAEQKLAAKQEEAQAELDRRREAVDRLVKPIGETLAKTDERLASIERARLEQNATIVEQIKSMGEASRVLRDETSKLTKALSRPDVRGRYGEIQLRRVVELAGMTSWCDFTEQAHIAGEDTSVRPDMVIRMPSERLILVDAKTNTQAYVDAANAETDDEREALLDKFAGHVADQVRKLSQKTYWAELERSPDFVVMFVPGDQFVDAALARRPDLIERAAEANVILASPSTLIGLLRAVAVGWREHTLAEEARDLLALGKELHERAAIAFSHADKLAQAIRQCVRSYNSFAGSVDARLLPTLRKFEDAGVKSGKEIPTLPEVEVVVNTGLFDDPGLIDMPADPDAAEDGGAQ